MINQVLSLNKQNIIRYKIYLVLQMRNSLGVSVPELSLWILDWTSDTYISCLDSLLEYFTGESQALQLSVTALFILVPWINYLPSGMLVYFLEIKLEMIVSKLDILENNYFIVFYYVTQRLWLLHNESMYRRFAQNSGYHHHYHHHHHLHHHHHHHHLHYSSIHYHDSMLIFCTKETS